MDINITLLIQIFHFIIAYFIFKIFLFKPTYTVLELEKTKEDNLVSAIEKQKDIIEKKHESQREQWRQFQHYFQQKTPDIENPELHVFRAITKTPELETIPIEVIKQRTLILEKELVKRVIDVD